MADAPEPTAVGIEITRVFEAPRERVWREWTEAEAFADWFGGARARSRWTPSPWTFTRKASGG
jgi:uncharacterized protein YndB with AHSA1/START domain